MGDHRVEKLQLEAMKHRISCEVLSRFPLSEIRKRSIENLERWRLQGTWGGAYDEWLAILQDSDDLILIASMIGSSERSIQLRQSMPYVGLLDQNLVKKIHGSIEFCDGH